MVSQMVKNLPAVQEPWVQSLGRKDPLKEETENHSSVLVWKISWTEEFGRLQSKELDTTEWLSTPDVWHFLVLC